MSAPLAGVRILDLSRLLPGPFLTQLLADLGADVVKVEEPGTGDYARWIGPDVDGAGYAFSAVNRGKRSIALDLKADGAADVVLRLAARSDVLVESFRPGVLDRLGLGDAALEAANPRLVRLSLVGYGAGPLRDAPGHDLNYEGVAGILAAQGAPDAPLATPLPVADLAGAMYGAVALLAALHERARTGRGSRLEVALADAAFGFNAINLARATAERTPARGAWELAGALPCYRLYRCRDGRFVALAALEAKFWARFVESVGRKDWEDAHLDGSPAMHAALEALFAADDADAWVARLAPRGVPLTPVLEPHEALAHPLAAPFGGRPGPGAPLTRRPTDGPVPQLGEHTEAVLREAGYAPSDVAAMRGRGLFG